MNHLNLSVSKPMRQFQARAARSLPFVGALAAAWLATSTAAAHDDSDLLHTCLSELAQGAIAFDGSVGAGQVYYAEAKPDSGQCDSYTWLSVDDLSSFVTIDPIYGGPNISWFADDQNAWDCNHSSMEYAVYAPNTSGGYDVIQHAVLMGSYANGICRHDDPSSFGSVGIPSTTLYPRPACSGATCSPGRGIKVAFKSWQHNDPALFHTGAYCSGTSCPWPSFLAINNEHYTYCSDENQTCNFSGTREVQYGALGWHFYQEASNGVDCSNGVFGDPLYGTTKQCRTGHRGLTYCASEWGGSSSCSFSGTKMVAFGARDHFSYKKMTGGATCSRYEFGDPLPGVEKHCYVEN